MFVDSGLVSCNLGSVLRLFFLLFCVFRILDVAFMALSLRARFPYLFRRLTVDRPLLHSALFAHKLLQVAQVMK